MARIFIFCETVDLNVISWISRSNDILLIFQPNTFPNVAMFLPLCKKKRKIIVDSYTFTNL